ncbi:hypothetical protein Cs7R123_67370 [Catellatospora sp. TT07R-123]|uniref:hypothetical protein n=1 Tax=Catellatospora sp. TT07R-123 TaxID=2733863 RepID=UPI001B024443|nr:hypothetical protein [Catellatospora sp. TT07R-123]GHJ49395.1 hypothetical protein Cs7R123_67370 [Catellatospora sp. TT07R-123]
MKARGLALACAVALLAAGCSNPDDKGNSAELAGQACQAFGSFIRHQPLEDGTSEPIGTAVYAAEAAAAQDPDRYRQLGSLLGQVKLAEYSHAPDPDKVTAAEAECARLGFPVAIPADPS